MKDSATHGLIDTATRVRVLMLAIVPSVLAGCLGTAVIASWRSSLPNPVATHWSTDGADGFSSPSFVVATPIVVGVVGALLCAALCLRAVQPTLVRTAVGVVAGVVFGVVALVVGTTAVQRDVVDASTVATPGWEIVIALFVGLVCGCVAAALVPEWSLPVPAADGRRGPGQTGDDAPRIALADDAQFMWTRTVTSSPVVSVIAAGTLVIVAVLALVLRTWLGAAVLVLVLAVCLLFWSIRVTVDRSGVSVRGPLGWPRRRIPATEIDRADVVDVRALAGFGGFGYRISIRGELKGAKGFVLRSGPALELWRTDGRREVIVVDDASTAAALVNHVLRRAAPGAPPPEA
ncbi:DUF1648 domain-containing protein [Gordonia sp. CPCC 206044]|uniref:DUF1648 domain-containing protein n=1 Tax=Gordonia sp. CPCC 206044 TaxID=3140793 RepID=UPI003AF39C56